MLRRATISRTMDIEMARNVIGFGGTRFSIGQVQRRWPSERTEFDVERLCNHRDNPPNPWFLNA
jgi:hypothetical protein